MNLNSRVPELRNFRVIKLNEDKISESPNSEILFLLKIPSYEK